MSIKPDPKLIRTAGVRLGFAGILTSLALVWTVQTAFAHTRVEIGPYTLVLGWQNEPAIVGERNALVLEILEGDAPVDGLEGSLELTVFYGGESFIGQLAPSDVPGVYRAEIFPTVRGQYEVQLSGSIGDEVVDLILEPEAVFPAEVLQFPEPQPDPGALAAEIDELSDSVSRLQGLAVYALAAGAIGLLLGAAAFFFTLQNRSAAGRAQQPEEK
jgi:hypothetical protein